MIEGHPYYVLHFHSFMRKFFFSRMIGELGDNTFHALMGHGRYLKTYDKRPVEECAAEYKTHMSKLYLLQTKSKATEPSQKNH